MWRKALLCVPAFLFLLAGQAAAQCRVEGVVRSADKAPMAGATVWLKPFAGGPVLTATTDAEGRYIFDKVTPGDRVAVSVIKDGRLVGVAYSLVSLPVETVNVDAAAETISPSGIEDLDPAGGPSGQVAGVVRDAGGRAVAGARIRINETPVEAVTDSAGRYLFANLRAGLHVDLHASAPGYRDATSETTVPSGGRQGANFALQAGAVAATGASLSVPAASPDRGSIALQPSDVGGVPALGRNEVLRGLQFLPAVAGTEEAPADLFVRGGTPSENLVTFDGFNVYTMPQQMAARSPMNADAIARVDFSDAATSAADGGRLSGVLRMTGRSQAAARPTGFFEMSMLGAGGLVSSPLGDRGSFLFTARRSLSPQYYEDFLDQAFGANTVWARDRAPRYSGGSFAAFPTSSFDDLNGKAEFRPTAKDRVSISVYQAHDAVNSSRDLALPTASGFAPPSASDLASDALVQANEAGKWSGSGTGFAWSRQWTPAVSTNLTIGRSTFSRVGDQARVLAGSESGADYSYLDAHGGSGGLAETNEVRDTTVRLDARVAVGFGHSVSFGTEIGSVGADYGAQTEVGVPAQGGGATSTLADLLVRSGSGRTTTLFAGDDWWPFRGLIVSPGIRAMHYDLSATTYLDPRVAIADQVVSWLRVNGAWGIDHQAIYQVTREDRLLGDGAFWTLADGSAIAVPRVEYVTGGATVEKRDFRLIASAYHRTLHDLTIFAPRLFPGTLAGPSETFLHNGSGTARGLELAVQWKGERDAIWVGYTAARVEYLYPTLEAGAFPGSQDQTHEFKVVDTAQVPLGVSVSAAWMFGSGRPYTPATAVDPVWFASGTTVNQVSFGAENSARLPVYHRLDVSAQREFRAGWFRSTLGVAVLNVYDRQNVAARQYQAAGGTVTTFDVPYMGRVFNAFARVGF